MSKTSRAEAIKKAVEQARLELGSKVPKHSTSTSTHNSSPRSKPEHETFDTNYNTPRSKTENVDFHIETNPVENFRVTALSQAFELPEPDIEIQAPPKFELKPTNSSPGSLAQHVFAIRDARNAFQRAEAWVRSDCTWEQLTSAISRRLPLYSAQSIVHLILVDGADDVLSPPITSTSKFFKIFPHYEEGMVFKVVVNEESEKIARELKELEDFRARALKLTFRFSKTGVQQSVYIESGGAWESVLAAIASEFDNIDSKYIKHIIVEDQDGDEITPPLNSGEKFWRFARSASTSNGDTFVFSLDEELIAADIKKREYEEYTASCSRIKWRHGGVDQNLIETLIPKDQAWDVICQHLSQSCPDVIKFPDWVDHLLLVDAEGDDLSPPLDGEVVFWKVVKTYDPSTGMYFKLILSEQQIQLYEEQIAQEKFRANAKQLKVRLEHQRSSPPTDIYVPHDCSWEILTEGVASFVGLSDPTWIDYFILFDDENEPLSPPLNTAVKFWKLAHKLTTSDKMILHICLHQDAKKILQLQDFEKNANSFSVQIASDPSRNATILALPDCTWEDLCSCIAEGVGLPSGEWISYLVLIDTNDGDTLSPPIKSTSKFWRFHSKMTENSVFCIYEAEEMLAAAIAEKLKQQVLEAQLQEERRLQTLAIMKEFSCSLSGTTQSVKFLVKPSASWQDILKAIASTDMIEAEFIDHLKLVDESGVAISVSISNAKLFWKFASSYKSSANHFSVFVNHGYRATVIKRLAEEARLKSLCLLLASFLKEEKPFEVLIPMNATWDDIRRTLASSAPNRTLDPDHIDHIVIYDVDGDQLSPSLDSASIFWSTWPIYHLEENMVFVISVNQEKVKEAQKKREDEEFRRMAKAFKVSTILDGEQLTDTILIPSNYLWSDVVEAISKALHLDEVTWVDSLVLCDEEGDALSKNISSTTLFWKTAATYSSEEKKVFTVVLNSEAIAKTRARQAHEAFLAAAEHIPVVLQNNDSQSLEARSGVIHVLFHSSWDNVTQTALESLLVDSSMFVSKMALVDSDMEELSPSITNSDRFWKIYQQNYKQGCGMSFAVSITNVQPSPSPNGVRSSPLLPVQIQSPLPSRSKDKQRDQIVEQPELHPSPAIVSTELSHEMLELELTVDGSVEGAESEDEDGDLIPENFSSIIYEKPEPPNSVSEFCSQAKVAQFLELCAGDSLGAVQLFVSSERIDVNVKNANMSSGMHFACTNGRLAIAQYLHSKGADLSFPNAAGITPFDCAASGGHLPLLYWLHLSGEVDLAPPKWQKPKDSPLQFAASNGHLIVVKWLLSIGARVNQPGRTGSTALMGAAHNGFLEIVRFLVKKGADVTLYDDEMLQAMHLAATENHIDIMEFLVISGAAVDEPDRHGKTPLMHACACGNFESAKWLVDHGANVLTQGGTYDTKNTTLHVAAQSGNLVLVKWLVEDCRVKPNSLNERGASAADFARVAGFPDLVEFIESSVHLSQQNGETFVQDLERALQDNNIETARQILELILKSESPIELPYDTNPLHYVAASGNIDLARHLLLSGADVNAKSIIGRTPIHYAAFKGKLNMIKYLHGTGANIDAQDQFGVNGLAIAQQLNNQDMIAWFKANSSQVSDGSVFSLFSCFSDTSQPSSFALDYHAPHHSERLQPASSGPSMPSPVVTSEVPQPDDLSRACRAGNLVEVHYLVSSGVDVRGSQYEDGSPLCSAIYSGNQAVVTYLLDNGAQICQVIYQRAGDSADIVETTPLHIACVQKDEEMILLLLRRGANPHAQNSLGDTPLHLICLLGMHRLLKEIIDLPRSVIASLNLDVRSSRLLNLLHCAADSGSLETVELLIAHEIGVNSLDSERKTPLHYACGRGALAVVQLLVSKGAVIDLHDVSNRSPFLYACSSDNLELVSYVLDQGADAKALTTKGNNALHIACRHGNLDLVKMLVRRGVDCDQKSVKGMFPIQYAQVNGYFDIVEWLQSQMRTPREEVLRALQHAVSED